MHKLSRISQYRNFCVLNFREFGQNSRNSRKFLLAKVSAPKVYILLVKKTNKKTEEELNLYVIKVQKSKLIKIIRDDRQMKLRSNTNGCELII